MENMGGSDLMVTLMFCPGTAEASKDMNCPILTSM